MKKFLKYCFLICLPLLIAAVFVEIAVRHVPNSFKYKYDWMQKNAEEVEILIFGSSHTFFGVRPDYFEMKAFNLANSSQGNRQDFFLLQYWGNKYKNLKMVIMPISYFTWFSRGLEYGSESYRCRYYKIYMDCDLYSDFSLYNLELSDIRTVREKFKKFIKKDKNIDCDSLGWGTAYKLSHKDMIGWNNGSTAAAAVTRHTAKTWEYIDPNYERLQNMAEFCKSNNIQLVLITTPCWHSYYDNLNREQLKKTYELTRQLQREYGLPYFDYLKDPRFEPDDFYDSDHLSDIGAAKFTKILNADIQSLLGE